MNENCCPSPTPPEDGAHQVDGAHQKTAHRLGRRNVLRAASTAAAAVGAGALGAGSASAAGFTADHAPTSPATPASTKGASVVLLGTSAGPPPRLERKGISSAVVVDGAVYVVDAGRSSVDQYQRAGLKYADLAGIFLTHLHADHFGGLYDYGLYSGIGTSPTSDIIPSGVPVVGPGSAGALPPGAGGSHVDLVAPDAPMPGLAATLTGLDAAYAYSSNIFRLASPKQVRDITTLLDAREIPLPDVDASALGNLAPPTEPFTVFEDDRVRVSATLVPHGAVFPCFAYRFDTDHGSVTFSGDTRRSANVITLARDTNLLVHEAISLPEGGISPAFDAAQRSLHTLVDDVGGVAQAAGAQNLVLSHLIDFAAEEHLDPVSWRRRAQVGYGGPVVVGADLMSFRPPK